MPPLSVDIGREQARDAAQRELSREIYHRDDPSLFVRALLWVAGKIQEFLQAASGVAPGGWAGLLGVIVLLVLAAVAIQLGVGPVRRSGARGDPLMTGRTTSAEGHRTAAERYAAAEEWAEAVRERLRAIARTLEERAILEPRPGRTADELAAESGLMMPARAQELRAATLLFDDIWYGGRPATADAYATLRDLDDRLRTQQPAPTGSTG